LKSIKLTLTLAALLLPRLVLADLSNNSWSSFYAVAYVFTVVPVLLWIANLVYAIRALMGKTNSKNIKWLVHFPSILLGLVSFSPVIGDLQDMYNDSFSDYWYTLILMAILPIVAAIVGLIYKPHLEKE